MNEGPGRLGELLDGLDRDRFRRVFTHSSWTDKRSQSYERLAFLGDSVLGVVVGEALIAESAGATAGDLTKVRAQAASRAACARVAQSMGLAERLAEAAPPGSDTPVDEVITAQSVLAEVCEAVIGAVFEQYGYEQTAEAVAAAFAGEIASAWEHPGDFKSLLQELLARQGERPVYSLIDSLGPAHDQRFECAVEIRGARYGTGIGRSKKLAEQAAAQMTLAMLEDAAEEDAID